MQIIYCFIAVMTECAILLPPNGVLVYVVDSKIIPVDCIITDNSEGVFLSIY